MKREDCFSKRKKGPGAIKGAELSSMGDVTEAQLRFKPKTEEEQRHGLSGEVRHGRGKEPAPLGRCSAPEATARAGEQGESHRRQRSAAELREGEERSPWRTTHQKGKQNDEAEERITKKKGT